MKKINTVKSKQLGVFLLIILFLSLCSSMVFYFVKKAAVDMIYRQMVSQAEYYVGSMDSQMEEIMRQQSELFIDRQLIFLADERLLDDYEKRNALLSVQERLFILVSSNKIVKDATLYIPSSNRVITLSEIVGLDEGHQVQLEEIKTQIGRLVPASGDLLYSISETPNAESIAPFFYLQMVLDKEQLIGQLNNFALPEGGVCWYNSETGWFLEDTAGLGIGREILETSDRTDGVEKARVDKTAYLTNMTKSKYFGMLIQYCSQKSIMKEIDRYTTVFYGFILLAIGSAVLFSGYTERLVNRPLQKLYEAFQRLRKGDLGIQISHSSRDEFEYIYEGFNHTVRELQQMIDEVYVQKNLAAQAELKQLQAQISPHFLYNSFFIFSGRVGRGDFEGARIFAEYMGTYFRYLARNSSDVVMLSDEILHAEAYARIQETRFASRMDLIWEPLPEEAERLTVPRLIVQPILENSYKYGLEDMEEGGILQVSYVLEPESLNIYIENNGEVSEEIVETMQCSLSDAYKGEVTGIINVHRRLNNFFNQKGGLYIRKGNMGGVLVIMKLPLETEVRDASSVDCR